MTDVQRGDYVVDKDTGEILKISSPWIGRLRGRHSAIDSHGEYVEILDRVVRPVETVERPSDCCGDDVVVDGEGTTHYHRCVDCGEPCDLKGDVMEGDDFEVGDRVRCADGKRHYGRGEDLLEEGEIYEIESIADGEVKLEGVNYWWVFNRFEPVEEADQADDHGFEIGDKVRATNRLCGRGRPIEEGEIVTVAGVREHPVSGPALEIMECDGEAWDVSVFEPAEEDQADDHGFDEGKIREAVRERIGDAVPAGDVTEQYDVGIVEDLRVDPDDGGVDILFRAVGSWFEIWNVPFDDLAADPTIAESWLEEPGQYEDDVDHVFYDERTIEIRFEDGSEAVFDRCDDEWFVV